jgi:two-component system, NarL family, response regulator NreC
MLMDTKVLLADDHAILREGLHLVLDRQPGILVVGEAENGREAVAMVEELQPDVVVMDISMPNLNGLEATAQIRRRHPEVKVVILTMHDNQEYLRQIVKAGAIGCVLKRSAGTELVAAVKAAARSESYFSPAVASRLVEDYRTWLGRGDTPHINILTGREREVLQLVAEGRNSHEVAEHLGVSIKTVQTHRAHLMRKLDAHDRSDLVRYAARKGLVSSNT